ncbi:MAG: hypothetical protein N2112_11795 [Gemmataceae bacterium]|nr:hypothetical protein [Gemmataceae bacterium]
MTSINLRWLCLAVFTSTFLGIVGCGENRNSTTNKTRLIKEPEQLRKESLESLLQAQTVDQIKSALAQLDNQGTKDRPKFTEDDQKQVEQYFKLNPEDLEEMTRVDFTPSDAAYLDDYFYVRSAIKSLELEGLSKLQQAQETISWCARMCIFEKEAKRGLVGVMPAVPAKLALQAGGGNRVTRANLWLTALRTLGFTSCLIGPPSLEPVGKPSPANLPNIRAVGILWEREVYVFELETGKLITAADGKTPLTLKQIRTTEPPLKGWDTLAPKVEEIKTWLPHVVLPMNSLTPKMRWLQTALGASHQLHFAFDVKAYFDSFGTELPAKSWSSVQDPFHPFRLITSFATKSGRGGLQDALRRSYFPLHLLRIDFGNLPEEVAEGIVGVLANGYQQRFDPLRFEGSPRDLMIQGKFQEATAALGEIKGRADRDRQRAETQPVKFEEFQKTLQEIQNLMSSVVRATNDGDQAEEMRAKQKRDEALKDTRRTDILQGYIGGETSQPVAAEAAFVLAQLAQEKAIRYQNRYADPKQVKLSWQNARDSWKRFLDNYPKVKGKFPDMERHAQMMMAIAEEHLKK